MDVIVNPTGSSGSGWDLNDRLGRRHGMIYQSAEFTAFEIEPEPTSALLGVNEVHGSLAEAMSAIARRMRGACELNSHDWK
jgi:hypothetical protein